MLAKTPNYYERKRWSQLFHYSTGPLLNNTNVSGYDELEMFQNDLIGKQLSFAKEFVIKLMLLSAPLMAVMDKEESLFEKLFGDTKLDFNHREKPLTNLTFGTMPMA